MQTNARNLLFLARDASTMDSTIGGGTYSYSMLDFDAVCSHVAANGFADLYASHGVPIGHADLTPERIDAIRQTASAAGLGMPVIFVGAPGFKEGSEAAVQRYTRLIDHGADYDARVLIDCGVDVPDKEAYFDLMRRVAPHAEATGLNISMKPHGGFCLSVDDLIDIHKRVDRPAFGVCMDPGNIIYYSCGRHLPETNIAALAPHVTSVVIKDCVIRDGVPDVMVVPGTGLVDFEKVIGGLRDGGFNGPFCIEKVPGETVDELDDNFKAALRFARQITDA